MTDPGSAARSAARTARWLVVAQFLLLAVLVLAPSRPGWPTPGWLVVLGVGAALAGGLVALAGAAALGRGLTPVPLPNRHAVLRTDGVYRWVRHPIYAGLLLACAGYVAASGGLAKLAVLVALVALLTVKARWEEGHLARRFPGYGAYAARTPRFVPRWWR